MVTRSRFCSQESSLMGVRSEMQRSNRRCKDRWRVSGTLSALTPATYRAEFARSGVHIVRFTRGCLEPR